MDERYAILIANSEYEDDRMENLRCPVNDVEDMNELLSSEKYGDFTECTVLKNIPHHEISRKTLEILKKANKNDLVLIYYSGHGKLDGNGQLHLATSDTSVDLLKATSIPMASIKEYAALSPSSKIIIILDCCFSGAAGNASFRSSVDDQLNLISQGQGYYLITASTGIQVAKEKELDRNGLFTKYIIEGIKEGKADENSDGKITIDELFNFVSKKMEDDGTQTPMKWGMGVRGGELFIAHSQYTPRDEEYRKIIKKLSLLANKDVIPYSILEQALALKNIKPCNLTKMEQRYDTLLKNLIQKKLSTGHFIGTWIRIRDEEDEREHKQFDEHLRIEEKKESKEQAKNLQRNEQELEAESEINLNNSSNQQSNLPVDNQKSKHKKLLLYAIIVAFAFFMIVIVKLANRNPETKQATVEVEKGKKVQEHNVVQKQPTTKDTSLREPNQQQKVKNVVKKQPKLEADPLRERYQQEIELYLLRLKSNPNDEEALIGLGDRYHDLGNYSKAIDYYTKYLEINPYSTGIHNAIGIMYKETGDIDRALVEFDIAIDINPKEEYAYFHKGELFYENGSYLEAIENLEYFMVYSTDYELIEKTKIYIKQAKEKFVKK